MSSIPPTLMGVTVEFETPAAPESSLADEAAVALLTGPAAATPLVARKKRVTPAIHLADAPPSATEEEGIDLGEVTETLPKQDEEVLVQGPSTVELPPVPGFGERLKTRLRGFIGGLKEGVTSHARRYQQRLNQCVDSRVMHVVRETGEWTELVLVTAGWTLTLVVTRAVAMLVSTLVVLAEDAWAAGQSAYQFGRQLARRFGTRQLRVAA